MGSLSLLQWIFATQELNRDLLHCRQILYQLSYEACPTVNCFRNYPARTISEDGPPLVYLRMLPVSAHWLNETKTVTSVYSPCHEAGSRYNRAGFSVMIGSHRERSPGNVHLSACAILPPHSTSPGCLAGRPSSSQEAEQIIFLE